MEEAEREVEGERQEEERAETREELDEKIDKERMDKVDKAIEIAEEEPGQKEGPKPKKLSKIQKAYLEFYITLLNNYIT